MSMTDEEKKAIEIVQGLKVYYDNECLLDEEELEENKTVNNAIDMVLNLVEKQQKDIKISDIYYAEWKKLEAEVRNNYVSKDKIKELRNIDNIDCLQFKLKNLLKEEIK